MITTQHSAGGTSEALQIIEAILIICASMEIGKNTWHAVPFEGEPEVIHGKKEGQLPCYVTSIGIRIQRKKTDVVPKGWYQKLMYSVREMLEPEIVVRPLFGHTKVHCLNIDLVVNKRRFTDPKDSWLTILFRKDLEHIFKIIKTDLAKEMQYRA